MTDQPLRKGENPLADQLIEENDRLRRERNGWIQQAQQLELALRARMGVDAQERIDAVIALHKPYPTEWSFSRCDKCGEPWDSQAGGCSTVQMLKEK